MTKPNKWMYKPGERMTLEEAMRSLPDKAGRAMELDWIYAHPAMARLASQKDKTKDVEITAADLLEVSHGKCPSKGAAIALQHWVNRPGKFYEMILSEDKKKKSTEAETAAKEKDLGLPEIEQLLKQISGAVV